MCLIGVTVAASPDAQPTISQTDTSPALDAWDIMIAHELLSTSFNVSPSSMHLDPRIVRITCNADSPGSHTLRPMFWYDYYRVIQQILTMDLAMKNRYVDFPTGPAKPRWRQQTAEIYLYSLRKASPPPFPMVFVAHVAALIAKRCMTEEKKALGGVAKMFGDSTVMFVLRNPNKIGALEKIDRE